MGNPKAFQSRVSMAPRWAAGRCGWLTLSSLPATLHSTQTARPPEWPSSVAWRLVFACPTLVVLGTMLIQLGTCWPTAHCRLVS